MFEAAEVGRKITKEAFKKQVPKLREQLLQAQFALSKTNTPVIIIISGVDAAGRGEVVNALNEWMDPRGLETIAIDTPTDEEQARPYFWRYWRQLPARGRIGIFFGGWYVDPIQDMAYGQLEPAQMDEALIQIRRFESLLVEDGALILKYWLHLSKDEQCKRLHKLSEDPHTRRSVSDRDWQHAELYDAFTHAAERAIRHTDSGDSPWHIIESTNTRYRDLTVAQSVLENLNHVIAKYEAREQLRQQGEILATAATPSVPSDFNLGNQTRTVLDTVDLTQTVSAKDYRKALTTYQGKLHRLAWEASRQKRSTLIVFEGWDAAGKGGSIRRMTQAMDARLYRVISTAAPTDEERAHHYLWRFWRHIPRAGMVTVYDRTWYGRVLVERVEGFANESEWKRAYLEINNFEENLAKHGIIVLKFWLHLDQEEQLRRFKEREQIPYKRHKITEEDWRNREKWDEYVTAIDDMVARTSTEFAPWTLIAGNDKRFARLQVLETVCQRLEAELGVTEEELPKAEKAKDKKKKG